MNDANQKRWKRIGPILDAILEMPADQWPAFLDKFCADQPELRDEIEPLLTHAAHMIGTIDPEDEGRETVEHQRIGPYRLLDRLGEGGMGEVWLAEQQEPVKRIVALKVIKRGMDTRQFVARFEAERQALAMMDHPAIAKVYDAGATPHGRPYFVMEHVQGLPLTRYCERHKLTNRERLKLFMQICEGVQHAHQKAVIHRDLKPGNVLITILDDKPVPKIIDFGVAKATAQKLTEATMHTQFGAMIGTPAYMSPEQADPAGQGIDTRTDVYALGVMLYELLVDALPFDPKELQVGLKSLVRKIREDEPPPPSARLTTMGDRSTRAARCRRTDLSAMKRELSGDLDWITMKALEKDRTRRYSSSHALAADIERYLTHQPVLASPPSAAYRARKFVRRHTGGVVVSAAGLLVLIVFAVTMAVQAGRIAAERDRANQEAEAKGQVSEFLKGMLTGSDPGEARGNQITAQELLDKGAEKIEGMLEVQPEIRAELMVTMGEVYRKRGLYQQAEPLLERALAERQRVLGDDHPDTLTAMNNLAGLYFNQGRYDEAEPLHLKTLETRKRVLGDGHPDTLASMNNLADLYQFQGRHDEALPLYLETLKTRKRELGEDHPDTLVSMHSLATLYWAQGRHDEAEPLYIQNLGTRKRVLGDDHPDTLASMNNLAGLYQVQGRYDEAEPLYLETLEMQKHVLGDDHPDTLRSMGNLAALYSSQGHYDKAEPLSLETLETQKRVLGEDHPDTTLTLYNLACFGAMRGEQMKAMKWLRQSVKAGWAGADLMVQDSDLESLHGSEFDTLVERARQNAADQRAD